MVNNFQIIFKKNISFFINETNTLINEIKEKIDNIQLMELYSSHLDILDSIENQLLLKVNGNYFNIFLQYQDYVLIYELNENFIINMENELKKAADNIILNINNEIN